jgi:hypothetical protein
MGDSRPFGMPMKNACTNAPKRADQFGAFQASLLYCPHCRIATPTRERLLLVLPSGDLYEYLCQHCGTSTGSKTDTNSVDLGISGG